MVGDMRDLKFRVWAAEIKQYFYLDRFVFNSHGYGWDENDKVKTELILAFRNQIFTPCPPSTHFDRSGKSLIVEQFTGLKDSNGRDVYNNDIVRLDGEEENTWQIYFCNERLSWLVGFNDSIFDDFLYEFCHNPGTTYLEVVGNIHENPDLLK